MEDIDKTVIGIAVPVIAGSVLSLIHSDGTVTQLNDDIVVGRSADCGLHIDDSRISRRHAQIRIDGDSRLLEDLGSANGTYVNGERLEGVHTLCADDTVAFDNHQFTVCAGQAASAEPEPAVDIDATIIGVAPVDLGVDAAAVVSPPAGQLSSSLPSASVQVSVEPPIEPPIEPSKPARSQEAVVPGSWVDSASVDGTQLLNVEDLPDLDAMASVAASANKSDLPHLVVNSGRSTNKIFELPIDSGDETSVWELGRDASCEVVLDDSSVSSKHAQLVYNKGRWRMVNMVSTNGIVINGEKKLSAYLADGDQIQLGAMILTFRAGLVSVGSASSNGSSASSVGSASNTSKSGSTKTWLALVVVLGLAAAIGYFKFLA